MEEVIEFFSNLFNPAGWPARWVCGEWTQFHGWLYIIASLMIATAYFAIPVTLYRFLKQRKDIEKFKKVLWLFILFIWFCGTTHMMDAIMFYYPAYRLTAFILLSTGIVSWIAVVTLNKIMPYAITLKSPMQLEQVIDERTLELNRYIEQLQEANIKLEEKQKEAERLMAIKDEFLSMASHELKTPITSLLIYNQILERSIKQRNDTDEEHLSAKITTQIKKLTALINDLLDVSKIQAGNFSYAKEPFSLDKSISAALEDFSKSNPGFLISVSNVHPCKVTGDKMKIEQVLSNYLSNAAKFSTDRKEIIVSLTCEEGFATVCVQDFGIGIPKEEQVNVFERFHRLHSGSQRNFPGLGLGLYICREIIHTHDGEVWVESTPGEGSKFYFKLPAIR